MMKLNLRRRGPRSIVIAAGGPFVGPSITINGYSTAEVHDILPQAFAAQETRAANQANGYPKVVKAEPPQPAPDPKPEQ